MAHENNNMDPQEFPFKPISARQFLDLSPLSMSEEEKEEMAAEMERLHINSLVLKYNVNFAFRELPEKVLLLGEIL